MNFLLFFGWNVLAIVTFVRYLIRPTALLDHGEVSAGFRREYGISDREAEVVELVSHGMTNKEIARYLNISFTTARTHVYNIFKKTGARTRVELLRIVSGYRE
jgi:DNA-binding CsgD family transcriptional regulator